MGFLGKGLSGRRVGIGNSASDWSPLNASVGVRAWYRPDLGLTEAGGLVSELADQSGSGDSNRNQVAVLSDRPGYSSSDAAYGNKPVLTFDGTQRLHSAGAWSVAPDHPITIIIVGQAAASTTVLSEPDNATPWNLIWSTSGPTVQFYGATGSLTSTGGMTTPSVVMFTDDGVNSAIYINNLSTSQNNGSSVVGTGTSFSIGDTSAGVTYLSGKIAEIIIFAGVLTPTDTSNLATYLNVTRAYGLGVTV